MKTPRYPALLRIPAMVLMLCVLAGSACACAEEPLLNGGLLGKLESALENGMDELESAFEQEIEHLTKPQTDALSLLDGYFEEVGFLPQLSGSDLEALVRQYRGGELAETIETMQYDGPYGYGMIGTGEDLGFGKRYDVSPDESTKSYITYLYTGSDLENLPLPGGISFKSTLEDVLKRWGMKESLEALQESGEEQTLLLQDRKSALYFYDHTATPASSLPTFSLCFVSDARYDSDGWLTRRLTLSFDHEQQLLSLRMELTVRYTTLPRMYLTGVSVTSGEHTILPYGVFEASEEYDEEGVCTVGGGDGAHFFLEDALKYTPEVLERIPKLTLQDGFSIYCPVGGSVSGYSLWDKETNTFEKILPEELPDLQEGLYYLVISTDFTYDSPYSSQPDRYLYDQILRLAVVK